MTAASTPSLSAAGVPQGPRLARLSRLAALPAGDRRLLRAMAAVALLALGLGLVGGLVTALARAGFIDLVPYSGYRYLTVHGVAIFFYWLFVAQCALLLALAAAERGAGLAARGWGWAGFAAMAGGFAVSLAGAHMGTPLLYDGSPELGADLPAALLAVHGGYLLLALGLLLLPVAAIATLLAPTAAGVDAPAVDAHRPLSAVGFALFAWAGFLAVTGFAALYTFSPGVLWALGLGPFPQDHGTRWHIVFHNMHYLPLMATVILWYVLVQALTGVHSVFGERFSKLVFAMYLVFVPPTSLYHMFLEPDLPGVVRVTGSLLSLFVSVPTLTAFLIIVASLEMHARAQGGGSARSVFGWIRQLPWRHPAMAAIGVAVASMGAGLALAFVLIQSELAPLLSDSFFVPGYFHFFTVGTVSLTLLAGFALVLPALGGRTPAWPALLRWLPWLVLAGVLVFGAAGVAAGYVGVPRRMIDVSYQGDAPALWAPLMATMGIGALLMAVALAAFAAGVAASLWPRRESTTAMAVPAASRALPTVDWGGSVLKPSAAWVGPLSVLLIVGAMVVFTALGFELMQTLPIAASGGGHAH
ncbi:MAG: cbb3-type cytochrome c oxidase subunit I [Rubrivivax sp.]|nr:cbb3-type cytochrome c oxidase subunit I [Rubrivivax sp.]